MTSTQRPLEGLVVVDLSTSVVSATTSMVFADFGAEVISVEKPGGSTLRAMRSWPYWLRGKRSIELDLTGAADRAAARRLCEGADVVIESFLPGHAERWGLGYEAVAEANPAVVWTSITAFGRTGPLQHLRPYEAVVMAKTGSMYGPNPSGREGPVMLKPLGASMAGALLAIQGTLVALHERYRSGVGQRVDATMIQGMLAQDPWTSFAKVLAKIYPDAFSGVAAAPSQGRPVPTTWLTFGLLTGYTKDQRWMQFAHATPKQFEAFVAECGLGWTRTDPAWSNAPDSESVEQRDAFWTLMLEAVASKTTEEWQAVFDRNSDTFAEIFRAPVELFDHPQVRHDGHLATVEVPGLGKVREMAPFAKLFATPGSGESVPPAVGEHTAEVLARPAPEADAAPPAPAIPADDRPPLDGILVLDLGTFYAGPFASAMLADQGARVIHVEPLEGDPIRYNMPFPEWAGVRVTQGKESLAVDLFAEEGKAIVLELLDRADLVLHSYRGGVAKRMGLDVDSALARNPGVVYHHAQGYGIDGPYARRSAYAPTIAAGSGFARHAGGGGPEGVDLTIDEVKERAALMPGAPSGHPDGFAALGVAAAMALGLVARDRGHGGQGSMTSMISTMGMVMGDVLCEYDEVPAAPEPDPELLGYGPLYRLYRAADGWVVLCATSEREWASLAQALAAEVDLAADPRFATADDRGAHASELAEVLAGVLQAQPAAVWEQRLSGAGVGCAEVLPFLGGLCSGLMDEGGVAEQLGLLATVVHPLFGEHPRSTALVTLSRSGEDLRPGCLVGQHTDAILRELGYDDDRIAELRATKVIG